MCNLSPHFSRKEFACKCGCGFDTVDAELLVILEELRTHFGGAVVVNSGARCAYWQKQVTREDGVRKHPILGDKLTLVYGGPVSQHTLGRAADIIVLGAQPAIIYAYLDTQYSDKYGIGKYNTFTHIDSRAKKARW